MALEINIPSTVGVTPKQEIQLAKIGLDLYLGQALKAVVVSRLENNEVRLNINGQNINAQTSHKFTPGDLLNVKVVSVDEEIVLQVQPKEVPVSVLQKTVLQNALLQALPKQAPPTNLLENLNQLAKADNLPPAVAQQIKAILGGITPLAQLPQQLTQAINKSGVFLESALLNWQPGTPNETLSADVKGQFLKLLNSLPASSLPTSNSNLPASSVPAAIKSNPYMTASMESNPLILKQGGLPLPGANPQPLQSNLFIKQDTLPLPGAIPQPLHKDADLPNILNQTTDVIQKVLHEQVSQALARITGNQINHLSQENQNGFLLMLDLPVKTTEEDIDVIPLMIEQENATPTQPTKWSMSFALSLSQLGDIQGTVTLNGNNINLKINTEKPDAIQTIQEYQDEISQALTDLGLNLKDFNIQLGLESNKIDAKNLRLLDIRI